MKEGTDQSIKKKAKTQAHQTNQAPDRQKAKTKEEEEEERTPMIIHVNNL